MKIYVVSIAATRYAENVLNFVRQVGLEHHTISPPHSSAMIEYRRKENRK
jgi:hypothetical protein